jgi:hypothetical protein
VGSLEASPRDEAAGQRGEGVVEFGSAFPTDGKAFALVEQGKGLPDDVAEFAQALDVRAALAGDDRQHPQLAQFPPGGVGVVGLVTEEWLGWRRGRPGRPVTGGIPSTRARVWVTSLTPAAVTTRT